MISDYLRKRWKIILETFILISTQDDATDGAGNGVNGACDVTGRNIIRGLVGSEVTRGIGVGTASDDLLSSAHTDICFNNRAL